MVSLSPRVFSGGNGNRSTSTGGWAGGGAKEDTLLTIFFYLLNLGLIDSFLQYRLKYQSEYSNLL